MTNLSKNDKVNEILTQTGLDFRIDKQPLFAMNDNGIIESQYYGLINESTNEVINTVKKGYAVSQNDEVVELVLKGTEKFGTELNISNGGAINGGRKVFLQLAIEGNGIVGNDTVKRYITILDSNDGSTSLSIGISDFTMSCSNQYTQFYKMSDAKFRHSANLEQKILTIPSLIEEALSHSLKQIELYKAFASTQVSRDLAHKMVQHVLGYDKVHTSIEVLSEKSTRAMNIMDSLYNHIESEMNSKGNNVWGLHSGVTSFTTHEQAVPNRANGRIESILNGNAYKTNQKSLAFAESIMG